MGVVSRIFLRRRQAYRALFLVEDTDRAWWEFWKPKYKQEINYYAEIVLADLRKFCCATGSKFGADDRNTSRIVGRDEVWQRTMSYLNVSEDQIHQLVERIEGDGYE